MSKFPTQSSVIEATLEGMSQAQKNFLFWTNNRLSLSAGPQKILSIHVAQALSLIENAPEVFIDATVSDILRCSLPNRKAFKAYMEKNALSPKMSLVSHWMSVFHIKTTMILSQE